MALLQHPKLRNLSGLGFQHGGLSWHAFGHQPVGHDFDLSSDSQYRYITISSPNGSVLIDSLVATVPPSSTPTPEPSSATLLLFGLAGLAGIGVLAKK